jgi:tetratricopeptide (TPR) repeat protein
MKKHITLLVLLMITLFTMMSCNGNAPNPLLIEARKKVEINQSEDFYYRKAWEFVKNEGEASWNAVANFEKAIDVNQSKADYYNDLANCYRGGFKDYKTALEFYNKAIEKGFIKGFVYYNRAICKFETSDLVGACSDNQTAINNGWNNDHYEIATKAKCTIEPINKIEIAGVYSGTDNVGMESTILLRIGGSMVVKSSIGDGTPSVGRWSGDAENLSLYIESDEPYYDNYGNLKMGGDQLLGRGRITKEGLQIIGGKFYRRQ